MLVRTNCDFVALIPTCDIRHNPSSHPSAKVKARTRASAPMLYKTLSAAVYGIDASIIEVEVDVSGVKTSEDHFHTVGLPDAAVGRAATGCGLRLRIVATTFR